MPKTPKGRLHTGASQYGSLSVANDGGTVADEHLELYSPEGLPNTLTLADMPYRTFTRNQLLVSFLSRQRSKRTGAVFLESRGEGVRKILRQGEAHSGRKPEYRLFGEELRLTLWRAGVGDS